MSFTSSSFPILVIIGPSGTGKSTAIRQLTRQKVVEVIPTWTTRPPRPDELEGVTEHKFVSEQEFQKGIKEGFLLEAKQMFGLPYWYGLPKFDLPKTNRIPLIVLRATIIGLFTKHYSNYIIYQVVDTSQRVEERINKRKQHGEEVGLRLKNYNEELELGYRLAKRSFVNDSTSEELSNRLAEGIDIDIIRKLTVPTDDTDAADVKSDPVGDTTKVTTVDLT